MMADFSYAQTGVHSFKEINQRSMGGNTTANILKLALTKGAEKFIDHGRHEFWDVPGQLHSRDVCVIKVCLEGGTERVSSLKALRNSSGH
jgi:hypothetical protein